jgi:hypothetical protein
MSDEEKRERNRTRSARPKPISYVPVDDLEYVQQQPHKKKKKHKFLKITGLVAAMLIVAAGTGYAGISYYYSNRFFEGTRINGTDCSGMTAYEVEQLLADEVSGYSIEVLSRNQQPQSISGSSINYHYTSDGAVLNCLKSQKSYEWILGYFEPRTYTVAQNTTYDKELLRSEMKQLECAKAENQVAPEDAYVAYNDSQFEIVPESEGSELNLKAAYQLLESAIQENQASVDFTTSEDAYESAEIVSTDESLQAAADACNNYTRASITYTFGDASVTLDGSVIKDWLQFDDKMQLVRDDASFQQSIADYVAQLAAQYDTVGTQREFYTTSGRTVYVYGSAYGWKIDQSAEVAQLTQEIQSGTQIVREPNYSMTANARGYNDLGSTYIEVDLADQHMYYYQNGALIFESDIVSGNPNYEDRATPTGIYTLYYKKSPDVLRGDIQEDGSYGYETEVTFWMPFNGGVGFHDATWQPYFGGDLYLTNGSHGCINLPYDSAATLYNIIQYNVPIIVFN